MGRRSPARPEAELRHTRRERILLTLFFLLHFGAIVVYVAPASPASYSALPGPLRAAISRTVVPAVQRLRPLTEPYLNAFSLRQHWGLFAPDPIRWSSSLEVTAYFPVDTTRSDPDARWRSETMRLEGPRERPFPHWGHNRWYRIVLNMGYRDWGAIYRPLFARGLCAEIEEEEGMRPAGLVLTSIWVKLAIPWEEGGGDVYRQALGGYTCPPGEGAGASGAGEGS